MRCRTSPPIREPANTVIYRATDVRTLADEQRGGFGQDLIDLRDTKGARATALWTWGRHALKGGVEWSRNENFRNTLTLDDALFWSFSPGLSGLTAAQLASGSFSSRRFNPGTTNDFAGLITTINGLPNRAQFYSLLDVDGNGTISVAELGSQATFTSTAGNPDGMINYTRNLQTENGPQDLRSDGLSFFAQDQMSFGRFTFNAGVRGEQWKHFATTGANIFTFDWEFAPRLSAAYDLLGDGRQKAFAFYGRYYDPIRNNMTQFAGTLTGAGDRGTAVHQQPVGDLPHPRRLQAAGRVLRAQHADAVHRRRHARLPGGSRPQHELRDDATRTAGRATCSRTTTSRCTPLATDGTTSYPGNIDGARFLWLGLDYFGYAANPGSNFVIGTLAGGKRDYHGVDLIFRKRYSDNWQALVSYTYNRAFGNTNSDSNADFQGDVLYLDPRAPNAYARQPGNIPHIFKFSGSYMTAIGVELGANYRWYAGFVREPHGARHRPQPPDSGRKQAAYVFNGATERWIADGAVGSLQNPSYGQFDLRAQYKQRIMGLGTEVFVDIFNVFDGQDSIRNQDLLAGRGGIAFGEPLRYQEPPRRFFLGARLSF